MSGTGTVGAVRTLPRARSLLVMAAVGLLAGGCSQLGSPQSLLAAAQAPSLAEATAPPVQDARTELQKATEYWGKAYAKNPRDAQTAINYAKNLKALGEKQQALAVLQQASVYHGTNRALNAEYGRLALEFDQVSLAQKLLEQADDPANPDWRVISARGTVLAKQGVYKDAIALYQRALTVAPERGFDPQQSGAGLCHGSGSLTRPSRCSSARRPREGTSARVNQNLALALGLQGKYDEAKVAAARDLPADKAAANVDYVRSIVNLEPKPMMTGAVAKPQDKPASSDPKQRLEIQDRRRGRQASPAWSTQVAVSKAGR